MEAYEPPSQFTFFESYYEAFEELDKSEQHEFYDALFLFVFRGIAPSFENKYLRMAWKLVSPNVESSLKRSKTNTANAKTKRNSDRKSYGNSESSDSLLPSSPRNRSRNGSKDRDMDEEGEKNHPSDDDSFSPSASGDAAAAGAAPPAAKGVECPDCGGPMAFENDGSFHCPSCGTSASLVEYAKMQVSKAKPKGRHPVYVCPVCDEQVACSGNSRVCPVHGPVEAVIAEAS